MKNKISLTAGITLFCLAMNGIFFLTGGLAQENAETRTLHELEINRAMLLRSRAEYERLKALPAAQTSALLKKNIENTEYKIKALTDDASSLISTLPPEDQTREFLIFMTAKTAKIKPADDTQPPPAVPATLSAAGAPLGPHAKKNRIYALHEHALKLVSQNRLEEALKIYEEIILIDPSDDQAYMIVGHTCMLLGDFNRSAQAFKNAVEIDHNHAGEILPFYQNMVLKNPGDYKAHTFIGYVYLMLGDSEKAKAAFSDALAINPGHAPAVSGLQIASGHQ